jgi:hypothetical protein
MNSNLKAKTEIHPFYWIAIIFLSIGVFWFILNNRTPIPFRQIAISVRHGFTLPILTISVLMYICLKMKSKFKDVFTYILIIIIFGFALAGIWASGKSGPTVINGLIPIVDSEMYYDDALRLINGGLFSTLGSGVKPIFSAYFASILVMAGLNLQTALAIATFFLAIGCFFSTLALNRRFGQLPATLFFMLVFLFTRIYIGNCVSELLAIPIGLIAFSILITKNISDKPIIRFSGYFMISFALNIRPGAFLILPALALWEYLEHRETTLKRFLMYCLLPILLGFLVNSITRLLFVTKGILSFSSFAFVLYGLAHGGSGWTQIFTNHPEIFSLPEPQRTYSIFQLDWNEIIQNPAKLAAGIAKQYAILFKPTDFNKNMVSFVNPETKWLAILIQAILLILVIMSVYSLIRNRKKEEGIFLFVFVGFLISVPFAPIQDFFYMRPYAATIGFLIVLPCLALFHLIEKCQKKISQPEIIPAWLMNSQICFGLFILLLSLMVPFIIKLTGSPFSKQATSCPPDSQGIIFNLQPDSSIIVRPEKEFFLDWMPVFHRSEFLDNIHYFSYTEMVEPLAKLKPPFLLTVGINLNDHKDYFIVIQNESFFGKTGLVEACGNPIKYVNSPVNWQMYLSQLFISQSVKFIN